MEVFLIHFILIEINKSGGQGDVVIKTSEYAAKLAGTQFDGFLQDHLRVDRDGFSKLEATQFKENQDAIRQEAVQIIEKQKYYWLCWCRNPRVFGCR